VNALTRWVRRFAPGGEDAVAPSTPPGVRLYAIGDIHGRADLLDRLHARVRADMANHPERDAMVVYLGDYVDRGPDSRAVLETLSAATPDAPLPGARTIYLKGNHEQAMLDFIDGQANASAWLDHGGMQTLASYGVEATPLQTPEMMETAARALDTALPDHHARFLSALPPFAIIGDYLFVHAGIRPGIALDDQHLDDLLFIREPFLSFRKRHPYMVVHGHHVVDAPDVRPNRIGIDTGAFATGTLTCLVLDGTTRGFLST